MQRSDRTCPLSAVLVNILSSFLPSLDLGPRGLFVNMATDQVPKKRLVKACEVRKKDCPCTIRSLKMIAGAAYLPKKHKDKPLGEDAHFICDKEQTIGVADGVGGWAELGIDSGIYARELMKNAVDAIQEQPEGDVDPKQVLEEAFLNNEAEGASTACIITLKDNFLHVVNLGDSGFLVIRDGKTVYKSPVQQSSFNCPFQLGNTTGYVPRFAEEIFFDVEPGDVLVAATDGLFDNVFPDEIEDALNPPCQEDDYPPELAASNLVKMARRFSFIKDSISPFTEAAMAVGLDYETYMGGKYDDVTVIVAYIY